MNHPDNLHLPTELMPEEVREKMQTRSSERPDPPLLHLYSNPSYHMDAHVVGNRAGLIALRDAINEALEGDTDSNVSVTPDREGVVFTTDGEGYAVVVIRQDTPWREQTWIDMLLSYTEESSLDGAKESSLTIWPHQLRQRHLDALHAEIDLESSGGGNHER